MSNDFEIGAIRPIKKVGIQPEDRVRITETRDIKLDPEKNDLACPKCGEILDGAGGYSFSDKSEEHPEQERAAKPRPGCPSICCKCGEYLMYDGTEERLKLRAMTPEEWKELQEQEPAAASFLALARRAFRTKNEPRRSSLPFWS